MIESKSQKLVMSFFKKQMNNFWEKKIKNGEHDLKNVNFVVEIKIHSNWKGSIFDGEIIFFVVFKKQLSLLAIVLTNLDTPIDRINVTC